MRNETPPLPIPTPERLLFSLFSHSQTSSSCFRNKQRMIAASLRWRQRHVIVSLTQRIGSHYNSLFHSIPLQSNYMMEVFFFRAASLFVPSTCNPFALHAAHSVLPFSILSLPFCFEIDDE